MKKSRFIIIILILALGLSAFSWSASSKTDSISVLKDSIPGFSADNAYEHTKHLVQKIGPRPAGSKSELKAAQYIDYVLRQNGWKVREQPFSKIVVREASVLQREQQVELISSQNIIAELPGKRPDTIIVGAHYDSATVNAPGAVDNGSGVGVLLELARVLSQESHEETYQLVFFGAEEYGLVGSQFYTSQSDLSAVRWMLNIDMVGSPLEIDVAGKKSTPPDLIKQVVALAGECDIPFHLSRDSIIMTRESSQGGTSDYSPFLDQNIPAVGLGIYGRPEGYFHRPEDRLDQVSLEEFQKVGDFSYRLLTTVGMDTIGPHEWDEFYLPFQLGKYVIIVPSYGIRIITILTFLLTVLMLIKIYKNHKRQENAWQKVLAIIGVTLVLSVIVVITSGIGEVLWGLVKEVKLLYIAYPLIFVIARLGIALAVFLLIAGYLHKLPIVRDPLLYWVIGVSLLLGISLILALTRIDLAFPFVFWLLCMNLQFLLPNIILVLIGPYFLISMHWELLNSHQWISFYQAIHNYILVFLVIYSVLLVPFFLSLFHIGIPKRSLFKKILFAVRKPSLGTIILLILALGMVPAYTKSYPQVVAVQEEWSGQSEGKVHVYSDDPLPAKVIQDLGGQESKSIYVPILNEKPPINMEAEMVETTKNSQRILDITLRLNYSREPYLTRIRLESDQPFEVLTDEFLPMSKLPRKLELKGIQHISGKYSIVLQRTPPQRNHIHLTIATQGVISCSVEAMFSDPSPRIQIQHELLSIDYQIWFKEKYDF
ncbi:M28 family metallopeptidase [Desulfosporosinus meridiei]|uniref:Putative aminopeptidase n=1 Tax=Desulfosporosinus meridiei (strain ATCC BAA-275 / DSM 13257 / KCTC 12902 / NCIMB 13706 / S10) TaxID=768704 RepID=J7IWJ4_DESMD|nr:M28 family metallopeptidase [Desulfosporosinus meridiei]AFQ44524.1 putative aminopeptidase [Desulfosporosinus meridiei DSM 13257]